MGAVCREREAKEAKNDRIQISVESQDFIDAIPRPAVLGHPGPRTTSWSTSSGSTRAAWSSTRVGRPRGRFEQATAASGSTKQRAPSAPLRLPTPRTGGIVLQVRDVDAHFERTKAGGAAILREPTDEDYGL